MGRAIVESRRPLRRAHGIRELAPSRNEHDAPAAAIRE
jgi:hypothetical protein